MAYVVSIHKPSTVRHGLTAKFIHEDQNSLIVARSNRIEVYDIAPDGLQLQTHFTVYGSITALLSLRPKSATRDHLFIATDRYDYFTVSWNPETGKLQNERKATDVTDRFQRQAQHGHLYLRDPYGRMLGLYLYEGIFTAIPIVQPIKDKRKKIDGDREEGNLDEPCPIRMNELKVISIEFLYVEEHPVIAVLFHDSKGDVHLKTYEVTVMRKGVDDGGLKDWAIASSKLDPMSKILIPIPAPIGGVVVVGEQVLTYLHQDRSQPLKRALFEASNFCAYGMIDETRYLLGSETGGLFLLLLVVSDDNEITSMKIEKLGETSIAKCIVYLDNTYFFVGSHFGDPQLLKINSTLPRIEAVDTLTNLAPISDFAVLGLEVGGEEVHQYSSGQTTILTCSGGFQNGSLKSVRSGVGMEELGILGEMPGVRGLWALKTTVGTKHDDTLILSFVDETRVLKFGSDGDVEELDNYEQFTLSSTTLVAQNIGQDRLIQVTPDKVCLVDRDSTMVLSEWSPSAGSKINLASCNDEVLVLVIDGMKLSVFDIKERLIQETSSKTFEDEIACINVPPEGNALCIVGFWNPASVAVVGLPSLNILANEKLSGVEGVIPRSLLLIRILENKPPTLFVAMGDGSLFTFSISEDNGSLSERKSIILGTQAVNLQAIPRKGSGDLFSIFATCDHPTMVYGEEGKIVYSAVTAEKATFVTPFHAEAFSNAVVVASEHDIRIASVDSSRTSHTRLLPLKQFARRIAIAKSAQLIGIGTITNHIDASTGMEASRCSFKVVDENLLDVLDAVDLNENELVEALICTKLPDNNGQMQERFIISTSIGGKNEDAERGRLLIFEFGEDRRLHMILGRDLRAACYSLAMVNGRIVAGLSTSVDIYKFSYPDSLFKPQLQRVASARVASIPVSIAVNGSRVFVGDLMKGVMLLEYKIGEKGEDDKLEEVGRQYAISWVTALEALGDDICISADADMNLMVLQRDSNGITEEDRRRLYSLSEMKLGEMVNRIKRVNEPTYADAPVSPKAYIATVEGSLYLFGVINKDYLDLLMKFQTNLSKVVKTVANLDFNRFRAFHSRGKPASEPFRFVDGDLIERFLDLSPADMEKVIKGEKESDRLDRSVEELKNTVEILKRMH